VRTSIDKQPSGRWRARYYDDADRRWYPTTFDTERECKAWLAEVRVARTAGNWVSPRVSSISFAEWADLEFWPTQLHLARKTLHGQRSLYAVHLRPHWGNRRLGDITTRQISAWAAGLATSTPRGLAPNTSRLIYTLFSKMMGAAADNALIAQNPMPKKRFLPKPRALPIRILDQAEVERLADVIDPRYRAMVLVMAYGGFRIGEIAALRLHHLDFTRGTIRIEDTQTDIGGTLYYHEGPKTERGNRTVTMPWSVMRPLRAYLDEYLPDASESDLVFRSPQGTDLRPGNFRNQVWTRATVTAGLAPMRPHELRHTAVSTWIASGASAVSVAARAGDEVGTVMRVYAHLFPGDEDRLRDALDARIRGHRLEDAKGGTLTALRDAAG